MLFLRKYFLFIILLFLSLQATLGLAQDEKEYTLFGRVFYDENKNGIKNDFEKGIAGVKIKFNKKVFAITDENGEYTLKIKSKIATEVIFLDKNSLPGGSILTNEENFRFSSGKQLVYEKDFGIFYPKKEVNLKNKETKEGLTLFIPKYLQIKASLDQENLKIANKVVLRQIKSSLQKQENFHLKLNSSRLKIQKDSIKEMKSFILSRKALIQNVFIHMPASFKEENDHIINDIKFELMDMGITSKNIIEKTHLKPSSLFLSIQSKNQLSCQISKGSWSRLILPGKEQSFKLPLTTKEKNLLVQCGKKRKSIEIPKISIPSYPPGKYPIKNISKIKKADSFNLPIKIEKKAKLFFKGQRLKEGIALQETIGLYELLIVNQQGIEMTYPLKIKQAASPTNAKDSSETSFTITHAQYLHLSRDFMQSFEFQDSSNQPLKINGRTIHNTNEKQTMILHSQRGLNTINIERGEKQYSYQYQIMEEPSIETKVNFGYYDSHINVSEFDTNYTTKRVSRLGLLLNYFPTLKLKKEWGFSLQYAQDVEGISLELNDGTTTVAKYQEAGLSVIKRQYLSPKLFKSLKYTFGLGLFKNSSNAPKDSSLFVPEDLKGISAQVSFLWERVGSEYLNLSTKAFSVISLEERNNYLLRLTSEVSYSLNPIGKIFNSGSYYSHYYRYPLFQDLRINLSLTYENSRHSIQNAQRGLLSEKILLIQSGLSWQY